MHDRRDFIVRSFGFHSFGIDIVSGDRQKMSRIMTNYNTTQSFLLFNENVIQKKWILEIENSSLDLFMVLYSGSDGKHFPGRTFSWPVQVVHN